MTKKIGPLLLSGLMIGPILGSGIILLPPLAYHLIGSWSLLSWLIIMILGALFALCFSKLSMIRPGDGGMANAIEEVLGIKPKLFASLSLIAAVLVGPAAVLLAAADYIAKLPILHSIPSAWIAIILVLTASIILMKDLKIVSTMSLIISSLIAIILITSSIWTVNTNGINLNPNQSITLIDFGRCTLLLFWAIVGWEVIGNYSAQVRDIKKTMPIATAISVIVITFTYLLIALAINSLNSPSDVSLIPIIRPLFGSTSQTILVLLITGLCLSTYLLIVGAIARLIRSLAKESYLPAYFQNSNSDHIPVAAVIALETSHIIVLILKNMGMLSIDNIVN